MSNGLHFTVASSAGHHLPGKLDLSEDLALVKTSLLYADKVRLCSVGSSLLSAIAEYAEAPEKERAKLVVRYLPVLQPSMSADEVRFFEAAVGMRSRKSAPSQSVPEGKFWPWCVRKATTSGRTSLPNTRRRALRDSVKLREKVCLRSIPSDRLQWSL